MFKQVKIPAEKASERPKGDTAFILLLRSTYSPPLHPRQNQSLLVFRGTPIVDSYRKFQKNSPSKNLFFAIHLILVLSGLYLEKLDFFLLALDQLKL
jgi:hypothetical protein